MAVRAGNIMAARGMYNLWLIRNYLLNVLIAVADAIRTVLRP